MSDDPRAEMLKLFEAVYQRGLHDAKVDETPEAQILGYVDIQVMALERLEQVARLALVTMAFVNCDSCAEGSVPRISDCQRFWVHDRIKDLGDLDRRASQIETYPIRCESPSVWTYLATLAKLKAEAKKGGG